MRLRHILPLLLLVIVSADAAPVPRREDIVFAPRPSYPYEMRMRHIEGRGAFTVHLRHDGTVASVEVTSSTGVRRLDQEAVKAL